MTNNLDNVLSGGDYYTLGIGDNEYRPMIRRGKLKKLGEKSAPCHFAHHESLIMLPRITKINFVQLSA
jgi:hypothetical protein